MRFTSRSAGSNVAAGRRPEHSQGVRKTILPASGEGRRQSLGAANRIDGDSCTVYGEYRFLVFYEPKRKLAGALPLKAGSSWRTPAMFASMTSTASCS
jgi:hypothetical protein